MIEALDDIEEHIHQLDDGSNVNIMVHQRLRNSDWVFLFFANANDFFAPARMYAAYVGISVFILTLIGIVLTLFLVRPLAGRISIEADSLRDLLQGREEFLGNVQVSEERLQSILDNTLSVVYVKDRKGNHLLVNRCYEEATGLSRDLVIGRTDYEIFPTEVADAIIQRDQGVFAGKQPVTFEESVLHPDGTVHDYLSTKVPLLDEQGQVDGLFGLASDITQSKKLQRELSQAKEVAEHLAQTKSLFLSNMSHEIRTPLNGVLGLARMGEQAASLQKADELFKKITHSGEHLLQVVNDILDFSRIEAGKLTLETQAIKRSWQLSVGSRQLKAKNK